MMQHGELVHVNLRSMKQLHETNLDFRDIDMGIGHWATLLTNI